MLRPGPPIGDCGGTPLLTDDLELAASRDPGCGTLGKAHPAFIGWNAAGIRAVA